ncbi:hypothetical protein V6N13_032867 [Hibiscus sabdariffa]
MLVSATLLIVSFLCLGHWYRNRSSTVRIWPVVGMLAALASNADRMLDFFTDVLKLNGGTFKIQGPWSPSWDFLVTANPMNINHIFCKNHENYEKGQGLEEILEPYEGIVSSSSHVWKRQRKVFLSFIKYNKKSAEYMDQILQQVLEGSLIPVLEHFQRLGTEVDLEDVLEALSDIDDALRHRKIVPQAIWKLQKWLQIGTEKKLSKGLKVVDDFLYRFISSRRDELRRSEAEADDRFDALTAFMVEEEGSDMSELGKSDKFLRDFAYDFLAVGKDSTTIGLICFLWLVATHPSVEAKILEEIKANCPESNDGKMVYFDAEELNKFVYLHAAFCETLRLYPSVPLDYVRSNQSFFRAGIVSVQTQGS